MQILAYHLVRLITEYLFSSGVPINHLLIRTDDHDRVLGSSADQAEFFLALDQFFAPVFQFCRALPDQLFKIVLMQLQLIPDTLQLVDNDSDMSDEGMKNQQRFQYQQQQRDQPEYRLGFLQT